VTAGAALHCVRCGASHERWLQACRSCGAFNSLEQGSARAKGWVKDSDGAELIGDVILPEHDKIETGTREFDRVLGGGLAQEGSYILAGAPGSGKSTLAIQVASALATAEVDTTGTEPDEPWVVLYVAAEETKGQVATRGRRLTPECVNGPGKLWIFNHTDVLLIEAEIARLDPDIVVVDSANVLVHGELNAPAGSVAAMKAVSMHLTGVCKSRKTCLVMIAHVTKDDELAGPRVFEHLVDGVLMLEEESASGLRVLRAQKHRFAPTSEIGIFKMTQDGLSSVENPSALLLESHLEGSSGVCIGVYAEGMRGIMCEVQALYRPLAFDQSTTRIFTTGVSRDRVLQAKAVIEARLEMAIEGSIYVSVAGGIEPKDTGLDLPIALALLSAKLDEALPEGFCAFGEVGLAGEVRMPRGEASSRIVTARAMAFDEVMGPVKGAKGEDDLTFVRTLAEAVDVLGWDVSPKVPKKTRKKKAARS
jgi:DNA repair protein RadA/Sms